MKIAVIPFIALSCLPTMLTSCKNSSENLIKINGHAPDSANYTTVQWLDSLVNFGNIRMGEKIEIKFRLKNTGHKPLYLTNVHALCGCTVASYTQGAIAPGGTGEVIGAFDSNRAHTGTVRKTIIASTNSPNGNNRELIFTGVISESAAGSR
jgi:hypothetical protein